MLKKIIKKSIGLISVLFIVICCTGLFSESNVAYAPSIKIRPPDTVLMCEDSIAAYWKRMVQEKKKFRTTKEIRDANNTQLRNMR
jgi:hypothetical protein